ncbi:MAG: type II toxin-antitoxin system prevent-host-death family antitoxin [Cyanobium sp.]
MWRQTSLDYTEKTKQILHGRSTIVMVNDGKRSAWVVPLEQTGPRGRPGVLAGRISPPPPTVLRESLPEDVIACQELALP